MSYKVRKREHISRSKKGQMPFALIAVTLLLLGTMYGVVVANIELTKDNTETITDEMMSVTDAISNTEKFIEAGLGNIINDISTSESGTIMERMSYFDIRVEEWISSSFPLRDNGISVSMENYDISLGIENLKVSSDDFLSDKSEPSFFRAMGMAQVKYTTTTGSSIKMLNISADGTSGLPFIVDAATKFELSTSGSASILTELMTYQLSSLAQKRILDGYGALSEGGDKGTRNILTEDDVKESFRSCMSIIESLCFRTTADNSVAFNEYTKVDAAELLIGKNGYCDINLGTIVSQAIVALADQLIAKWLDLFFAKDVINFFDKTADYVKIGFNWLVAQMGGQDNNSARPYIESLMKNYGYSENDYRYIFGNGKVTINIEGGTFEASDWYSFEKTTYTIPSFTVTIDCPNVDILSWSGWNDFMANYALERNDLIEYVKNVVNTVAINAANNNKSVRINTNSFDDKTFLDNLSSSVTNAINHGINIVETEAINAIKTNTISDPKYISIYDKMKESKDKIFDITSAMNKINNDLMEKIDSYVKETIGTTLDDSIIVKLYEKALKSNEYSKIASCYENGVENKFEMYEKILTNVPKNNSSIVKDVLSSTFKEVLKNNSIRETMESYANDMVADMATYQSMNTKSGLIELEKGSSYTLYDADGKQYEEFISVTDMYDLDVKITNPKDNTSKNSHITDIDIFSLSPFTSVFTISLKTNVNYSVMSTSSILDALDWYDARTNGTFHIDTKFDIPCVSGWALAGVKYPDTTNIINEAVKYLTKICEPLIEPLKEIYEVLKEIFELCSTAIVEVSNYITQLIMQFYDAITQPLEDIQKFLENGVMEAIDSFAFDIGLATQKISFTIFGMTLALEFRAASLVKNTKNICKLTLSSTIGDTDFSASVDVKYNEKNGYMFKGTGELTGGDWKIKLMIDPGMKFGTKLVNATGQIRGVGFTASLPEVVQYDEIEMTVSDIPGVGEILSNIPLPIPGYKGSFDMGFDLKYNYHLPTGLLINEFESNPKGSDSSSEWVELYNASTSSINLDGYVLVPGSDESKSIPLSGKIGPHERKVINFEGQKLNNSRNKNGNGESLTLIDPYGETIDSTPWKTDGSNDDRTWQRTTDGGTKWEFMKGTPGHSNGTPFGGAFVKTFIIDNLKSAGEKAFYEMGNHLKSVDDIAKFLELIVRYFIEAVIESIADVLVSAAAFISFEFTDYAETQHAGLKVALEMNSEFVKEGLQWLVSQIGLLASYVDSPECTDPVQIVCNDTYIRSTVYAGMSAPKFLTKDGRQIEVGLSSAVNVSGMMTLFGNDYGKWKAEFGVVIEDCPFDLVPKKLSENKGSKCDLWLIKMTFCKV